ncbi:MAG: phenylalanine--tRNA ligase beta subunit-related protein [Chloroflexota bacterium]
MTFQYDADILETFPNTAGAVIYAPRIHNEASSDDLKAAYQAEQHATIERIGDTALGDLPSLAAWRRTFSAFGVSPTKTRSAPESLLRRLTKKGDIPSINALVDIGNLVSIRYALPVAVFDTQAQTGTLMVRYANGDERYTELGSNEIKHPEQGEVIFADDTGLVFARRWCWRQSFQSAAKMTTSQALIVVESQHTSGKADVQKAQADLLNLLTSYVDGDLSHAVLDANNPQF